MSTMVLGLAGIAPVTASDLNSDSTTAKYDVGGLAWMKDQLGGAKIFKYGQNRAGASMAQGSLASSCGDNDGQLALTNITSGTTTTATKAASMTASKNVGGLLEVLDNDDAAGAAPEGEVGVVTANTTAVVTIDSGAPFSVALAANDDLVLFGLWNVEASAAGDRAVIVWGCVVGTSGISDTNFGFFQSYGIVPQALVKATTALTKGDPLISDTGRVTTAAGTTATGALQIGAALFTHSNDVTASKCPIFISCGLPSSTGTVDVSA